MNARNVHAVIAAGVHHPTLLSKWQVDSGLLRSKGIAPETIDLAALRKFAGLTLKVRHNGLRPDLPLTFRLMTLAELGIEVFSAYATQCDATGHRYGKTSAERTRDLIAFLGGWLDLRQRNHSLLWDVIRHEQALAQLMRATSEVATTAADTQRTPHSTLRNAAMPRVHGQVILHRLRCDPTVVKSALFKRPVRLDLIPEEAHFYCYWRVAHADEVHILELDEFGFYSLQFIDGATSVAELSRRMGGGRQPTKAFKTGLEQLAAIGILDLEIAPGAQTL
jgi:hypothetical protein